MNAHSINGDVVELAPELIAALQLQIKGQIFFPGDAGYESSRTIWNAMIDKKPAMVIRVLGVADVITAVNFIRKNNLLLCIKGGGHNIGGLAVADGAIMLDLSLMRGVWVDKTNRIAHAQAGCLLGDVDRETQIYGLASVLGFVSQTGITGLTLGGGFGYLTRRFGWTSDNVAGFDIVTAEAKLVHASENENPDLFWGLRGGGGNFGVVVGIDYLLYPVGPEILGGLVAWPASEASSVLELYRKLSAEAPTELTLVCMMRLAPPAPWIPQEWHGKPIIGMLACFSGDLAVGENYCNQIKTFGKPIGDMLIRRPYAQMQSLLDATQPKGRRYYWKSEYIPEVLPALCEKYMANAAKIISPHSAMILFQLSGALNDIPTEHSAVGNREARFVFNVAGSWEKADEDNKHVQWVRESWEDMRSFSTGGTYINFLTEDDGDDRMQAAFGTGLHRLAEIKAKWDPENIFRTNRNIRVG